MGLVKDDKTYKKKAGTKRFQFLKILFIKPFKSIIKCEKRIKQNSDCQKISFVRFLYLRSDFCPSLFLLLFHRYLLNHTRRIATQNNIVPKGLGNDSPSSCNNVISQCHSRKDNDTSSSPEIISDGNRLAVFDP